MIRECRVARNFEASLSDGDSHMSVKAMLEQDDSSGPMQVDAIWSPRTVERKVARKVRKGKTKERVSKERTLGPKMEARKVAKEPGKASSLGRKERVQLPRVATAASQGTTPVVEESETQDSGKAAAVDDKAGNGQGQAG